MIPSPRIDCLQYVNWSGKVFRQLREGREIGLRVEHQIARFLGMVVVRLYLTDQRCRHATLCPALVKAQLCLTGVPRAIAERIRHRSLDDSVGEHPAAWQRERGKQGGGCWLVCHGGDVSLGAR